MLVKSGFKHGFLFPELAATRRYPSLLQRWKEQGFAIRGFLGKERSFVRKTGEKWDYQDTPLEKYSLSHSNFKRFLEGKAAWALRAGRKLRVLDVGIFTGRQWLDFLGTNEVDFAATSLLKDAVVSTLRGRVVRCTAANLHRYFKPVSFDVIVTHHGMHYQEKEGLECMLHLLKPGGHCFVTGEEYSLDANPGIRQDALLKKGYYKILSRKEKEFKRIPFTWNVWGFHLRRTCNGIVFK